MVGLHRSIFSGSREVEAESGFLKLMHKMTGALAPHSLRTLSYVVSVCAGVGARDNTTVWPGVKPWLSAHICRAMPCWCRQVILQRFAKHPIHL